MCEVECTVTRTRNPHVWFRVFRTFRLSFGMACAATVRHSPSSNLCVRCELQRVSARKTVEKSLCRSPVRVGLPDGHDWLPVGRSQHLLGAFSRIAEVRPETIEATRRPRGKSGT
jgi:hypothetical protein